MYVTQRLLADTSISRGDDSLPCGLNVTPPVLYRLSHMSMHWPGLNVVNNLLISCKQVIFRVTCCYGTPACCTVDHPHPVIVQRCSWLPLYEHALWLPFVPFPDFSPVESRLPGSARKQEWTALRFSCLLVRIMLWEYSLANLCATASPAEGALSLVAAPQQEHRPHSGCRSCHLRPRLPTVSHWHGTG